MNEPRNPGGKDGKPPPDVQVLKLAAEDMPEGLADAIAQAIEQAMPLPEYVDHGFIIGRARASGWDAKRLKQYYPNSAKWVREGLLARKLALDAHGVLHGLH